MTKWTIKKQAEDTKYTDEDKKIYNETTKLMKECVDILNTYIIQSKDMKFEDYVINDQQRSYRKQDLETLKQLKDFIKKYFWK